MIKFLLTFTLMVLNQYFSLINITSCLLSALLPLIELQSLFFGVVDEEERSRPIMALRESDCGRVL